MKPNRLTRAWLALALLLAGAPFAQAATGLSSVLFTNLNKRHFEVNLGAGSAPTNMVRLNLNPAQFDTNSSSITITITNVGGATGSSLWTNNAGTLQPLDLTLQPLTQFGWFVGTNSSTWWSGLLDDSAAFVSFRDKILGENDGNEIDIGAGNPSNTDQGVFRAYGGSTGSGIQLTRTNQSFNVQLAAGQGSANLTEASVFGWLANPHIDPAGGGAAHIMNSYQTLTNARIADFQNNSTNRLSVNLDGGLIFGPGTTNVLFRDVQDLIYTNGSGTVSFELRQGAGHVGVFAVGASGGIQLKAESGQSADLGDVAGNMVRVSGANFIPVVSMALGNSGSQWATSHIQTNYVEGFRSGTNYSRWAFYHTGTNGVILLSSQADGTAGAPRPFEIDRNLGATLTGGDATFVDMARASQTNEMSGAMTFAHATNGINLVEFTHVRTFYNPSGADRTVTLPASWHNVTGTSFVVTNNTVVKLYVNSMGSTATSATQTNVYSNVQYFP